MRKKLIYVGDLSVIEKGDRYLAVKLEVQEREAKKDPRGKIYVKLDIEEALTVLTAKQKECVTLVLDGYRTVEIARKIGISHPAAVYRLKAVYKKIKKYLL